MRPFCFIFLLVFLLACVRDNKIPKGILSQNEMHKVMWDLIRADAYVSNFIMPDSTKNLKNERAILYEKVFAIHSITEETFKKSIAFYESRPDLFKPVADSLKSEEKRVQEFREYDKQPPKVDSTIRKIKASVKPLDKQ